VKGDFGAGAGQTLRHDGAHPGAGGFLPRFGQEAQVADDRDDARKVTGGGYRLVPAGYT